jgi:hypothetical protein
MITWIDKKTFENTHTSQFIKAPDISQDDILWS